VARHYSIHLTVGPSLGDYGSELADLDSVRREAFCANRELLMLGHDGTLEFWAGEPWRLWVTDKPNAALTVELCASGVGERP